MNITTIKYYCTQNGPGFRTAVFVAGCRLHCKGCFNTAAWDFNSGVEMTEELINKIIDSVKEEHINGLSILGGEPMDAKNQEGVYKLVKQFRQRYKDTKTIWMWTGYDEDNIPKTKYTINILKEIDSCVVGPFIQELYDANIRYAGSSNQRIINFKEKLQINKPSFLNNIINFFKFKTWKV